MDWNFGTILWSMLIFFFWFTFIWIFVGVFADIFRRPDLSGWGKGGWIFLICVLPFLGCLIYMIARPKPTPEEVAQMEQAMGHAHSPADEIATLARLQDEGKLTPAEFEQLKVKALA